MILRLPIAVLFVSLVCGLGTALGEETGPKVLRDVPYAVTAGEPLTADVYLPKGEGPFPAVLVVHGGAWMFGNKSQLAFVARRLAEEGYVAVSINYRLAPKHKFPAQLDDCRAALDWMHRSATDQQIDPGRIGAFGYSAGGHLVTLLAATQTEATADGGQGPQRAGRLRAVVAGGAPCDFRHIPSDDPGLAYWLGGTRGDCPEVYRAASPACFVSPDDPPVLFFHGEDDRIVPPGGARRMAERLSQVGVVSQFVSLGGKGHLPALFDPSALHRALEFLGRHLQPGE